MHLTNNMQVVVLLGGLGSRLKGKSVGLPKSMTDICGKPFFYYQLKLMHWCGFRNFIFCIGYKGNEIKKYFGNGNKFGVSIKYSDDGENLLGTAGALRKASRLLNSTFLLIYGDSYMDIDYAELLYFYKNNMRKAKSDAILVVFKNSNRYDKSNVTFRKNRVLRYDKDNRTTSMKYIDYGVAILKKSLINSLPFNEYADLSGLYKKMALQGKMLGYETKNRFYEIGRPISLDEFRRFVKSKLLNKRPYIFLDRDGVLNDLVHRGQDGEFDSPLSEDELKLTDRVTDALRIFKDLGYGLIVVTNQPAAAKGKTSLANIYAVNNKMKDIFIRNGVILDDLLMCVHHPLGGQRTLERDLIKDCDCRKPKPGLLIRAFAKFNVDKKGSFVVGDSYTDMLLAKEVGLKSVFVGRYMRDGFRQTGGYRPDIIVKSLFDFAEQINTRKMVRQ